MGSAAMDAHGDMAIGYSVTDGTATRPGIRYAGRLSTDPLGQLSRGEVTLVNGTGVQTQASSHWGDYSMMSIDPSDDCTFWYSQEYYSTDRRHELADAHRVLQVPAVRALAELAPLAESAIRNDEERRPRSALFSFRSSFSSLFGSVRDLHVHLVVVPAFIPDGDLARSTLAFP